MKKRIIPVVIILILFGFFAYNSWKEKNEKKNKNLYYGVVEAVDVLISPQVMGQIIELNAKEGQKVKKGDLLVKIDDTLFQAQLEQAKAGVRSIISQKAVIEANLKGLQTNIDRAEQLYKDGATPKSQLDELYSKRDILNAQLNQLDSQIEQAKAGLNLVEKQILYSKIYSPMDGTVIKVYMEEGEKVFPGSAILSIADLSKVEIRVYIPEPMLGKIFLGQKVQIFTDSYPDKPIEGEIAYISDEAEFTPKNVQTYDERIRLVYAVKITADNLEGILKIGMPVSVKIQE